MSLNLNEHLDTGLELMGAVLGQEYADGLRQRLTALRESGATEEAIDHTQFGIAAAWGYMFHRRGVSLRDRSIAMLAADVTLHGKGALGDHVRLALHAGVTPDEVREIMFTLILYVGFPQVREATEVITPILEEFESAPATDKS